MIISKTVVQSIGEIVPAYTKRKVEDVIEEYRLKGKTFSIYVVLEEAELYCVFQNIYSIMDGMQSELALFSFDDDTVYQNVDNNYPSSIVLEMEADIYTEEQFKKWNVSIVDGVPEVKGTGFPDALSKHQ